MGISLALVAALLAGDDAGRLRGVVIRAAEEGAEPVVYVELFGRRLRGTVKSADQDGLTALVLGQEVSLGWRELGDQALLQLARRCASMDDKKQVLSLARFAAENKLRGKNDLLDRLRELDAEAAKALEEEKPRPKAIPSWALPPKKEQEAVPKEEKTAPRKFAYVSLGMGAAGGLFCPGASPVDPNFMLICSDMSGCYRTDDGGKAWRVIHHKEISGATSCKPYFHPTNVKIAVWKDRITRDKGWTWQLLSQGRGPWGGSRDVTHVACAGEGVLAIYVGTANGIWGSHSGGASWKEMAKGACGGIQILPDGTAYASAGGKLLRWVAGASVPAPVGTEGVEGAVKAVAVGGTRDAHVVHIVASGGVYTSVDSGRTWRKTQSQGGVVDVVMAKNQTDIAYSCDRKSVYVTRDRGGSWKSTFHLRQNVKLSWVQSEIKWGYYVIKNGLNVCDGKGDLVMMSSQGELFISCDAGANWVTPVNERVGNAPDGPGGRYRSIGLECTTTWDYCFDPFEPNRHYICYTDCGFARSVDRGKTWSWAGRGSPWGNTFYGLVFDPFQKGKIYAVCSNKHDIPGWTHVTPPGRSGGGVCISEDFAVSWKPVRSGLPVKPCCGIAIDRKASKPGAVVLYVTVYSVGVYKSTDSGETWTKKPGVGRPGNYHVYQVRVHPKTSDVFVNVTANRNNMDFPVNGGLWKSSDGGDTWKELTESLPLKWPNGFAVHPGNPDVIYLTAATCPGASQGGVYKTTDGGRSWQHVLKDSDMPGYVHGLFVEMHPDDPNVLYFGGSRGPYVSADAGRSWNRIEEYPFGGASRIRVDPLDKKRMFITCFGGGVFVGPTVPAPR